MDCNCSNMLETIIMAAFILLICSFIGIFIYAAYKQSRKVRWWNLKSDWVEKRVYSFVFHPVGS